MENSNIKTITKDYFVDEDFDVEFEVTHTHYLDHKEIEAYCEELDIRYNFAYKDKMYLENFLMQLLFEYFKLRAKIDNAVEDLTV